MPTLEQATQRRLSEIRDLARSGITELTGRAIRERGTEGAFVGRIGGLKPAFPELFTLSDSPQQIAAAIDRGEGKVFRRVYATVERAMEREGFQPQRKRTAGRPTVPPHEGRSYCQACREWHAKGQHRSHGPGSFHRTHLWGFSLPNVGKNNMKVSEAKRVFAELMARARERTLSENERRQLREASQKIRFDKRRGLSNPRRRREFSLYVGEKDGTNNKFYGRFSTFLKARKAALSFARSPSYSAFIVDDSGKAVWDSRGRRAGWNPRKKQRSTWTLQQYTMVAGHPWFALQHRVGGKLIRQYNGYRGEMEDLARRLKVRPRILPPTTEKKFFSRKNPFFVTFVKTPSFQKAVLKKGYKARAAAWKKARSLPKRPAGFWSVDEGDTARAVMTRQPKGTWLFGSDPTKRNPRGRRSRRGLLRMGKLVELRYYRDHGKKPGYYKHRFENSSPTIYYDQAKNMILVRAR
jgi:hypothetical protein